MSIYRCYLAQVLHNIPNKSILEPKFNPVLAIMPKIGEYPELLRYLALVWDYKYKSLKRSEKVNKNSNSNNNKYMIMKLSDMIFFFIIIYRNSFLLLFNILKIVF